jgi:hypothetical protein
MGIRRSGREPDEACARPRHEQMAVRTGCAVCSSMPSFAQSTPRSLPDDGSARSRNGAQLELFAQQWRDVLWDECTLLVRRDIVTGLASRSSTPRHESRSTLRWPRYSRSGATRRRSRVPRTGCSQARSRIRSKSGDLPGRRKGRPKHLFRLHE